MVVKTEVWMGNQRIFPFLKILSNLYPQRRVQSYNREIKSHSLHQLSQPSTPKEYFAWQTVQEDQNKCQTQVFQLLKMGELGEDVGRRCK